MVSTFPTFFKHFIQTIQPDRRKIQYTLINIGESLS